MNKCVICFHDAVGNLHHKSSRSLKNSPTNLTLKMLFAVYSRTNLTDNPFEGNRGLLLVLM